jgi:radical SAM superfamily enzyme YgiQ (UPF0313 family)
MIGNPGETRDDIEKTYEILKRTSPEFLGVGFITPYPGSELYEMAVENKWIDPGFFYSEEWLANQALHPLLCINFSEDELIKMRASLQNEFLGIKAYLGILKNIKFLSELFLLFLRHPFRILKRLKTVLKSRNIDDLAQIVVVEYRQEKARKKKRRYRALDPGTGRWRQDERDAVIYL